MIKFEEFNADRPRYGIPVILCDFPATPKNGNSVELEIFNAVEASMDGVRRLRQRHRQRIASSKSKPFSSGIRSRSFGIVSNQGAVTNEGL